MAGEFEKLLPFKWRDQEYPISNIRFALAHDLVEHKYWRVDGARIEDTGVAPIRISVDIPLVNHIYPGENETWTPGQLYPTALRKLFVDFALRTSGLLQHPEWGRIVCKAEHIECLLSSDRRGHAQITASWVQTNDDNLAAVSRLNPIGEMAKAAGDLDASNADLSALAPKLPKYKESFEDFMRSLQGIGDQVFINQAKAVGRINAIVYRIQAVQQSIDRARDPRTSAATQTIERMKEAADDLRVALVSSSKAIRSYKLPTSTTLAGAAAQLPPNTGLGDVMKLNPRLMASPVIPAGTLVRYYLPG